jgi:hypothetical protein
VRFAAYKSNGGAGLAIELPSGEFRGLTEMDAAFPGHLGQSLLPKDPSLAAAGNRLEAGKALDRPRA